MLIQSPALIVCLLAWLSACQPAWFPWRRRGPSDLLHLPVNTPPKLEVTYEHDSATSAGKRAQTGSGERRCHLDRHSNLAERWLAAIVCAALFLSGIYLFISFSLPLLDYADGASSSTWHHHPSASSIFIKRQHFQRERWEKAHPTLRLSSLLTALL